MNDLGRANPTTPLHPCTTQPTLYGRPDTFSATQAVACANTFTVAKHFFHHHFAPSLFLVVSNLFEY
ncbi:hypothetical protein VUR80DRAFT_4003 [Thermomyces stellatus]